MLTEILKLRTGAAIALVVIAAAAAMLYGVSTTSAGLGMFEATLSGDAEVPAVVTDASGSFTAEETADGLAYTLDVADIVGVTQAHIHLGPVDGKGGVVAFLFGPEDPAVDGPIAATGLITDADLIGALEGLTVAASHTVSPGLASTLVAELEAGNAYVNVHTEANGGGEVRGQISAVGGEEPTDGGEVIGVLELTAGGQFIFWDFGDNNAANAFALLVKIAWLFDTGSVSWTSWIPALGVTNFVLVDGSVLWIVTNAAINLDITAPAA